MAMPGNNLKNDLEEICTGEEIALYVHMWKR